MTPCRESEVPTRYVCDCGRVHKLSAYAIAQSAMGHVVVHACPYGRRNTLDEDGFNLGPIPHAVDALVDKRP